VLWSRRGNLFTARFPEITRACEKLPSDTLIDGEVVAIDEDGRVSFNALQYSHPSAHLQFYAFDLLIHRGRDLLMVLLETRRELLEKALEKVVYPVIFSRSFNAEPAGQIRAAKECSWKASLNTRSTRVRSSSSGVLSRGAAIFHRSPNTAWSLALVEGVSSLPKIRKGCLSSKSPKSRYSPFHSTHDDRRYPLRRG
jgi:hypothetical protein